MNYEQFLEQMKEDLQDWFLNRFPRTALKTERYFCCSEARQVIQ